MTEPQRIPTRRDLMKPAQLLGLSFLAALFAGFVTLLSMGFFQQRYPGESGHALLVGGIVAGITFIVTVVVIALLLLVVDPAQIAKTVDQPILVEDDRRNAEKPKRGAAASEPSAPAASAAAPDEPEAASNPIDGDADQSGASSDKADEA